MPQPRYKGLVYVSVPPEPREYEPTPPFSSTSESDGTEENSDDEDMFEVTARAESDLPTEYNQNFLYRWHRAVADVASHMRNEVLLPVDSGADGASPWFTDVGSGTRLPS